MEQFVRDHPDAEELFQYVPGMFGGGGGTDSNLLVLLDWQPVKGSQVPHIAMRLAQNHKLLQTLHRSRIEPNCTLNTNYLPCLCICPAAYLRVGPRQMDQSLWAVVILPVCYIT